MCNLPFCPLHSRLHTSIMHSYIHLNIHASHDLFSNICSLLLFQDSKANVVYDLRHDRITQCFESIDAFRDACCYSWDVGLSLESVMSVQPGGYPISHSTHSGFSVPLPGLSLTAIVVPLACPSLPSLYCWVAHVPPVPVVRGVRCGHIFCSIALALQVPLVAPVVVVHRLTTVSIVIDMSYRAPWRGIHLALDCSC